MNRTYVEKDLYRNTVADMLYGGFDHYLKMSIHRDEEDGSSAIGDTGFDGNDLSSLLNHLDDFEVNLLDRYIDEEDSVEDIGKLHLMRVEVLKLMGYDHLLVFSDDEWKEMKKEGDVWKKKMIFSEKDGVWRRRLKRKTSSF